MGEGFNDDGDSSESITRPSTIRVSGLSHRAIFQAPYPKYGQSDQWSGYKQIRGMMIICISS